MHQEKHKNDELEKEEEKNDETELNLYESMIEEEKKKIINQYEELFKNINFQL